MATLPYGMPAYRLLLADCFLGVPHIALIGVGVQALDEIDQHVNTIVAAGTARSSP